MTSAPPLLEECEDFARGYIDDITVYSKSWEEHFQHLQETLMRLQRAGLTVKMAKCRFGRKEVPYLGHIIGGGTIRPDPGKLRAIGEYPRPQIKKMSEHFWV